MNNTERKQLLILQMKQAIDLLQTGSDNATLHQVLLSIRKNSIQVDKDVHPGYWEIYQ